MPVYRYVSGEVAVNGRNEARPASRQLLVQVASVLGLRLVPSHPRERGGNVGWIAFFKKANLECLCNLHCNTLCRKARRLNCTFMDVTKSVHT